MNQNPDQKGRGISSGSGTNVAGPADSVDALRRLRDELEDKILLLSKTNRQLKRKIFDLYTVFEISRNFNAVLRFESLLDSFIFTCLGQVGATKGAVFLRPEFGADRYYPAKAKGSGERPGPDECFLEDSELLKYLTRLNRPVLNSDLSASILSDDEVTILRKFQDGVIVPLIFKTHLVGLLVLGEKISEQKFAPDNLELLSVLGNQIAVAIENARLYEAERDAMRQLRTAQQQLVQTERLAALGEMSAKVAHEINNPLGIIKNYVLLLKRAGGDNEDITEYADIVSQEISRIAGIVGQMADFQRPVKMILHPIRVEAVIEETLALTRRQLQSCNIEVSTNLAAGPHLVNGCRDSLKQVFLNLIINAQTAMEQGGRLEMSSRVHKKELKIQVCDTGPGITPEVISRIFEPFFTTKGDKGTGLGLSVCYSIIKGHKGSIIFRNLDPGSCFEITLPLVDDAG